MSEILNCPICNMPIFEVTKYTNWFGSTKYHVQCNNKTCRKFGEACSDEDKAINSWNEEVRKYKHNESLKWIGKLDTCPHCNSNVYLSKFIQNGKVIYKFICSKNEEEVMGCGFYDKDTAIRKYNEWNFKLRSDWNEMNTNLDYIRSKIDPNSLAIINKFIWKFVDYLQKNYGEECKKDFKAIFDDWYSSDYHSEINKCPICGNNGSLRKVDNKYLVECGRIGCISTSLYSDPENAIYSWNNLEKR